MKIHTPKYSDGQKPVLRLYVAGMSARSMQAITNTRKLCDAYLHDTYDLEIIDIYKHPEVARKQQVVFSPSLVKDYPLPRKILVGTLSDTEKVMNALGISTLKL